MPGGDRSSEADPPSRLVEGTEETGGRAAANPAVERIGDRSGPMGWSDAYHLLLTLRWRWFLPLVLLGAVAVNALFALAYLFMGGIEGAERGSFADAFYFSVQTMSTVGYGSMHPATHAANLLASAEAMLGMTGFALGAAVMFARVSRPSARVLFSRVAVVAPYEGRPALMFRVANRRHNQILEAKVLLAMVRLETTAEGERIRRFHELRLRQARTPIFSLPWTLIHPIDAESPLHGETEEGFRTGGIEIVALLSGVDDVFSQPVHARRSYIASEVRWNARFADVLERGPGGRLRVDFRRFHDVRPVPIDPGARTVDAAVVTPAP